MNSKGAFTKPGELPIGNASTIVMVDLINLLVLDNITRQNPMGAYLQFDYRRFTLFWGLCTYPY